MRFSPQIGVALKSGSQNRFGGPRIGLGRETMHFQIGESHNRFGEDCSNLGTGRYTTTSTSHKPPGFLDDRHEGVLGCQICGRHCSRRCRLHLASLPPSSSPVAFSSSSPFACVDIEEANQQVRAIFCHFNTLIRVPHPLFDLIKNEGLSSPIACDALWP